MESLDFPIFITPTLTLPPQRGREIPGFPDGNKLMASTPLEDDPDK